jgi:hypothetical protein
MAVKLVILVNNLLTIPISLMPTDSVGHASNFDEANAIWDNPPSTFILPGLQMYGRCYLKDSSSAMKPNLVWGYAITSRELTNYFSLQFVCQRKGKNTYVFTEVKATTEHTIDDSWFNWDKDSTDANFFLSLTVGPATFTNLSSALQTTFTNMLTAANEVKANPYMVDSYIDLMTKFNGSQITISDLNDQLQEFTSPISQKYNDLNDGLQYTFTLLRYAFQGIWNQPYNNQFVSVIEGFAFKSSTTTVQQFNKQLWSVMGFGDGFIDVNDSQTYSDLSVLMQETFVLLKDVTPLVAGNQFLGRRYSECFQAFEGENISLEQLNTEISNIEQKLLSARSVTRVTASRFHNIFRQIASAIATE